MRPICVLPQGSPEQLPPSLLRAVYLKVKYPFRCYRTHPQSSPNGLQNLFFDKLWPTRNLEQKSYRIRTKIAVWVGMDLGTSPNTLPKSVCKASRTYCPIWFGMAKYQYSERNLRDASHSFFQAQYRKVIRTFRANDFAAFVRTRVRPKVARRRSHVASDFIEFSFGPPVGRWAVRQDLGRQRAIACAGCPSEK